MIVLFTFSIWQKESMFPTIHSFSTLLTLAIEQESNMELFHFLIDGPKLVKFQVSQTHWSYAQIIYFPGWLCQPGWSQ